MSKSKTKSSEGKSSADVKKISVTIFEAININSSLFPSKLPYLLSVSKFGSLLNKKIGKDRQKSLTFFAPSKEEVDKLMAIVEKDAVSVRTFLLGNIAIGAYVPGRDWETMRSMARQEFNPKDAGGKFFALCKNGSLYRDCSLILKKTSEEYNETYKANIDKKFNSYVGGDGGIGHFEEIVRSVGRPSIGTQFTSEMKPDETRWKIMTDYSTKWSEHIYPRTSPEHFTSWMTLSLLNHMMKEGSLDKHNLWSLFDEDLYVTGNLLMQPFGTYPGTKHIIPNATLGSWMKSPLYLTDDRSILAPVPGMIAKIIDESTTSIIGTSLSEHSELRKSIRKTIIDKLTAASKPEEKYKIIESLLTFYEKLVEDPTYTYKSKEIKIFGDILMRDISPKYLLTLDITKVLLKEMKHIPEVQKVLRNWMRTPSSGFDDFVRKSFFSGERSIINTNIFQRKIIPHEFGFSAFNIFGIPNGLRRREYVLKEGKSSGFLSDLTSSSSTGKVVITFKELSPEETKGEKKEEPVSEILGDFESLGFVLPYKYKIITEEEMKK